MIRRLVDVDYFRREPNPETDQIAFWIRELRSAEVLIECVRSWPALAGGLLSTLPNLDRRAVIEAAISENEELVQHRLGLEEAAIRLIDRLFWAPLKKELEELRHQVTKS